MLALRTAGLIPPQKEDVFIDAVSYLLSAMTAVCNRARNCAKARQLKGEYGNTMLAIPVLSIAETSKYAEYQTYEDCADAQEYTSECVRVRCLQQP